MSQTEPAKAEAAEERTEAGKSLIQRVRTAVRRKYTAEERSRIVSEGFRREGIKPHSYYGWTKEFMEAGKERLSRDAVRDASQQEVQQLKGRTGNSSSWWGSYPWRGTV